MATLVISPVYEYGNFKSNSPAHKGPSLQGRKSPVNHSNQRRSSSTMHQSSKAVSLPHKQQQQQQDDPQSPPPLQQQQQQKANAFNVEPRKLERAMSEPADKRAAQSTNSSRYKTELCRPFEESGTCKYGDKCQFAHGIKELRTLARHPKYKTERCKSFHNCGLCPYGPRCHFIHNETESTAKIYANFAGPSRNGSAARSKVLPRQNLGSAGDLSPPFSDDGSPTELKSAENIFKFPADGRFQFDASFSIHVGNINFSSSGYVDDVFTVENLRDAFGSMLSLSADSGVDMDGMCNSPPLDCQEFFPSQQFSPPTSPIENNAGFLQFPIYNM